MIDQIIYHSDGTESVSEDEGTLPTHPDFPRRRGCPTQTPDDKSLKRFKTSSMNDKQKVVLIVGGRAVGSPIPIMKKTGKETQMKHNEGDRANVLTHSDQDPDHGERITARWKTARPMDSSIGFEPDARYASPSVMRPALRNF